MDFKLLCFRIQYTFHLISSLSSNSKRIIIKYSTVRHSGFCFLILISRYNNKNKPKLIEKQTTLIYYNESKITKWSPNYSLAIANYFNFPKAIKNIINCYLHFFCLVSCFISTLSKLIFLNAEASLETHLDNR